jgi:hypothetical protein
MIPILIRRKLVGPGRASIIHEFIAGLDFAVLLRLLLVLSSPPIPLHPKPPFPSIQSFANDWIQSISSLAALEPIENRFFSEPKCTRF